MAEVKIGRQQLSNPTPRGLEFWGKVYVAVSGAVIGWMQTAAWIPGNVQNVISSILGLTILIVTIATPFFGVETDKKTVPIEQVGSMEVKDEPK